jgi:hypothetical protein
MEWPSSSNEAPISGVTSLHVNNNHSSKNVIDDWTKPPHRPQVMIRRRLNIRFPVWMGIPSFGLGPKRALSKTSCARQRQDLCTFNGRSSQSVENLQSHVQYVVVGIFSKGSNIPKEVIIPLMGQRHLMTALWYGVLKVRGWKLLFSPKSVKGFGIYQVTLSHHEIYPLTGIRFPVHYQRRYPRPSRPDCQK